MISIVQDKYSDLSSVFSEILITSLKSKISSIDITNKIEFNVKFYGGTTDLIILLEKYFSVKFLSENNYFVQGDSFSSCSEIEIQIPKHGLLLVKVHIYGDSSSIVSLKNELSKVIDFSSSFKSISLRWYFNLKQSLDYTNVIEDVQDTVFDESYPFITEGINKYIEDFNGSSSTILLLIGEPGTGKTRFIRKILSNLCLDCSTDVFYTSDGSVLEHDSLFIDFISCDSTAMVLEDMDNYLCSREEGNPAMSKLLNLSNGIINNSNKKIIISTNLSSINKIDPALLRPGRCFDVINFRKLTIKEANVVKDLIYDDTKEEITEEITLGNVYNLNNSRTLISAKKTTGFY